MPMASQPKKRSHVITSKPAINETHSSTEMMGKIGTHGTLNPRGRSGCALRRNNTPSDTSTNAKSVPMLERSAASPMSTNPAGRPTAAPAIQVDQGGAPNRQRSEKSPGSKPSRDMANQILVWPY